MAQAADLCRALGHPILRPVKVEPCEEGPSKDQKGHFDRDDDEDVADDEDDDDDDDDDDQPRQCPAR